MKTLVFTSYASNKVCCERGRPSADGQDEEEERGIFQRGEDGYRPNRQSAGENTQSGGALLKTGGGKETAVKGKRAERI